LTPDTTANADAFIRDSVLPHYPSNNGHDPLILVASDGELYGHHQPWRDKFLAYLLNTSPNMADLAVTYPARYLQHHPVGHTIEIREQTSWSCHHGVERWRGDCGCCPGDGSWKGHLRAGLDRLATAFDELFDDLWQGPGVLIPTTCVSATPACFSASKLPTNSCATGPSAHSANPRPVAPV